MDYNVAIMQLIRDQSVDRAKLIKVFLIHIERYYTLVHGNDGPYSNNHMGNLFVSLIRSTQTHSIQQPQRYILYCR